MFVQVRLITEDHAKVLVVPTEAIQTVAGLTKIFKIQDGRVVELRINRGRDLDGWVEVRGAAIDAGATVAVSELGSLVNGTAVQPAGS
jgi:multidrug efflux pump subunit AcrA (membrane-fusion protein)